MEEMFESTPTHRLDARGKNFSGMKAQCRGEKACLIAAVNWERMLFLTICAEIMLHQVNHCLLVWLHSLLPSFYLLRVGFTRSVGMRTNFQMALAGAVVRELN